MDGLLVRRGLVLWWIGAVFGHLVMSLDIDDRLAEINRLYVHRNNEKGYQNFDQLLADMRKVIALIPKDPSHTEYWIRVAFDLADYVAEWKKPIDLETAAQLINYLEAQLVAMHDDFTSTQITRLHSIALRTRAYLADFAGDSEEQAVAMRIYENLFETTGASLSL